MSEERVDVRPMTSVELLDAAVWREIGSEEAQPASAFLDALSRLVGRWLLVRSDAPEMDAVTVLCKARSTQIQHWIWEEERVRVGKDGQPVLDSQKKFVKD